MCFLINTPMSSHPVQEIDSVVRASIHGVTDLKTIVTLKLPRLVLFMTKIPI